MTDFNTSDRDVTRAIRSWLHEDRHEDASRIAAAVLDRVEATPRRRPKWWPARRSSDMNTFAKLLVATAAVVVVAVVGINLLPRSGSEIGTPQPSSSPSPSPSLSPSPTVAPSSSGAFGGTVHYQLDGAPATTEVDVVAEGASVSGTAITTHLSRTHTVRLACATRDGDTWALGGTIEQTTVPGERAGQWSAVVVKDGSPQQIGIWFSAGPEAGSDCDAFLASADIANIGPENFNPVESGALVPPAFGGTVHYQLDGAPATTEVDVVADGASVSGTAITTHLSRTHTVRLACATRDGDTWALGGTIEQTTVPGERAGQWSAVVVKDGSPQQIGIWFSAGPEAGSDCDAFLASADIANIGPENFNPVESGALVPPA